MADSWEDEADAIAAAPIVPATTDKWEGEDADDVPDAWDAEPEVAPAAATVKKPAAAKPKKLGKKGIAEAFERKKMEEAEEQRRLMAANAGAGTSAAAAAASSGLSAEELRRIQEESDLLITKDTFGINDAPKSTATPVDQEKSIDLQQPSTKEEFDHLSSLIALKLRGLKSSQHYSGFIEGLYQECALELDPECLRRLSTMFTALAAEKQKMQKAAAPKAKGKKPKGTVKMERSAAAMGGEDYNDQYDDFDDFM